MVTWCTFFSLSFVLSRAHPDSALLSFCPPSLPSRPLPSPPLPRALFASPSTPLPTSLPTFFLAPTQGLSRTPLDLRVSNTRLFPHPSPRTFSSPSFRQPPRSNTKDLIFSKSPLPFLFSLFLLAPLFFLHSVPSPVVFLNTSPHIPSPRLFSLPLHPTPQHLPHFPGNTKAPSGSQVVVSGVESFPFPTPLS